MRLPLIGACLLAAFAACTEERIEECKDVCEREAKCAESSDNTRFDQNECVSACSALWRDPAEKGKRFVLRHIECVDRSADCHAVLECDVGFEERDAGPR